MQTVNILQVQFPDSWILFEADTTLQWQVVMSMAAASETDPRFGASFLAWRGLSHGPSFLGFEVSQTRSRGSTRLVAMLYFGSKESPVGSSRLFLYWRVPCDFVSPKFRIA